LLLRALAVARGESLQQLHARLHFDRQLLERLLRGLQSAGLARAESGWQLTDQGQAALDEGEHARQIHERRGFYFVESERANADPHFLPLADAPTIPWPAESEWRFDVNLLTACVERPVEWKQRFGFPLDVEKIVRTESPPGTADMPPWRCVALDRPERLVA